MPDPLTQETIASARRMIAAGGTVKQTALELGISESSVLHKTRDLRNYEPRARRIERMTGYRPTPRRVARIRTAADELDYLAYLRGES